MRQRESKKGENRRDNGTQDKTETKGGKDTGELKEAEG